MLDFNWGGGGISIYWPNGNTGPTYPNGTYPPTVYQSQTRISNGMLLLIAIGAYLLLRK